jgi:hypothetical protein
VLYVSVVASAFLSTLSAAKIITPGKEQKNWIKFFMVWGRFINEERRCLGPFVVIW